MPAGVVADWRYLRPSTQLAPLISSAVGYRYEGFEPGFHRGLSSCSLTVVISLGEPTNLSASPIPLSDLAASSRSQAVCTRGRP